MIYINNINKVDYEKTTVIDENITVEAGVAFTAPALQKCRNIDVSENAAFTAPALQNTSGDIYVSKKTSFNAPVLKESWYIYVRENASFTAPALQNTSGDIYVREKASFTAPALQKCGYIDVRNNPAMERYLFELLPKATFILSEFSTFLINKEGEFKYQIDNNSIDKELYLNIMLDKLSAEDVFSIKNAEIRRVAYEKMDKLKMKQLKDFIILDQKTDRYNNAMQIVSFKAADINEPFIFFDCFCPSTGREYFLQTNQITCEAAKADSFGFSDLKFFKEW